MSETSTGENHLISEQEAKVMADRMSYIMKNALLYAAAQVEKNYKRIMKERALAFKNKGISIDAQEELIKIGEKYWTGWRRIKENIHTHSHFDQSILPQDYEIAFNYIKNLQEQDRKNFFINLKDSLALKVVDHQINQSRKE